MDVIMTQSIHLIITFYEHNMVYYVMAKSKVMDAFNFFENNLIQKWSLPSMGEKARKQCFGFFFNVVGGFKFVFPISSCNCVHATIGESNLLLPKAAQVDIFRILTKYQRNIFKDQSMQLLYWF